MLDWIRLKNYETWSLDNLPGLFGKLRWEFASI